MLLCICNQPVIMVQFQQLPLSLAPTWPEPDLEKDKLTRVQISAPTSIQYDLLSLRILFGKKKKKKKNYSPNMGIPDGLVKNQPTMQETRVRSLGWEDSLEKGMATHSCILAWRIPWTEEPGRLQSMGSQRVMTE